MWTEPPLTPPTPPPRRRRSMDTASIDWKPPDFDSGDNVSMQEMEVCTAKIEKTAGQEKVERELKGAIRKTTHRERLSRLIYISMLILLGLFLINAAVVSFALWRASRMSPDDLSIYRIEFAELDNQTARVTVEAEIPDRWYLRLFNVILHSTVVKLYVPEAVRREQDKWIPLAKLSIPRVDIGRGGHRIDWRGIPLELSQAIPLRNLVDYFGQKTLRRLDLRVEFEIETISYWVPIRFSHAVQETIEIPVGSSNIKYEMPKLEGMEFVHDKDPNSLDMRFHVRYPKKSIPEYFFVALPQLTVDLGHYTDDPGDALDSNAFAQIKLLPHVLRHDTNGPDGGKLIVQISTTVTHKKALVKLLEKVRDGEDDWSLSIGSTSKGNHLQKWLSTISYEVSVGELQSMLTLPTDRLVKREVVESSAAAIDVGLVEIDDSGPTPKFVVKVSLGHDYVQDMLGGFDTKLLRGHLPKVTLQAMVDRGDLTEGLTKVFTVDVLHKEAQETKTDIFFHITLADVSTVVKAGHKMGRVHHSENIVKELGEYRAIVLRAPGRGILPAILRVFELQWSLNHGGEMTFRHGAKRALELPTKEITAEELRAESVKHGVKLDVTTDGESIKATGNINFAKTPALSSSPFVYVYWEALDISFYPVRSKELDHIELANLTVQKGHGRMLIAGLSPLQLLHNGSFNYVFSIRHTDTVIRGEPALIAAWRHMVQLYTSPIFPPIQVVGRIGTRKLDFETCLPPRSALVSDRTDLPRWVADVIKTRVKIAGFYEATIQVLLELPKLGTCRAQKKRVFDTFLDVSVTLPAIHANGCLYPTRRHKKPTISCVAKVGLHPILLNVAVIDGEFCDITTRLAPSKHVRREIVADNRKKRRRALSNPNLTERDILMANEDEALINFLPLSASITDLRGALEAADHLAGRRLRKVKTSVGFSDRRQLMSQDISLLDRMINGVGQVFPLSLPLYSRKKRPTRPPVKNFYRDRPLSIQVDVDSVSRTMMKGRILIRVPPACVYNLKQRTRRGSGNSLAFLMSVQWGRTLLTTRYEQSWLKTRISQGQLTFRLDENRVLINHGVPTTNRLVIEFAIRAHPSDFSSATMRRILAHLHNFVRKRADDRTSKRVMRRLPKKHLQLEVRSSPFLSETPQGRIRAFRAARRRKNESRKKWIRRIRVERRKLRNRGPEKHYGFKSSLPIHMIVEFWLRAWRRIQKSRAATESKYALVVRPKGVPGVREYRIPCFVASMCDPKDRKQLAPSGPFMDADITLFNAIQPAVDGVAYLLACLLDKLNFRRHPKFLAVGIRVSRLDFAIAINDMDIIELRVDPLTIKRTARLPYPHHRKLRKKHKDDIETLVVHLKLARRIGMFGELLAPWQIDPSFILTFDPVPKYKRHGHRVPVHFSPLNISFSNERLRRSNLLSSLVSMMFPETNVSPIFSYLLPGDVPMKLLKSGRDQMELTIGGIWINNPIPCTTIVMDEDISYRYIYKGYEFVRVKIGKLTLLPGSNPLRVHVTVSRTAFGKIKPSGTFVPEFSDFLTGLSLGVPVKVTALVDLSRHFRLRLDMSFGQRDAPLGVFNPNTSHVDWREVHDLMDVASSAPAAAWSVAKNVATRAKGNLWNAWDWTKGWANWAKNRIWGTSEGKRHSKRSWNEDLFPSRRDTGWGQTGRRYGSNPNCNSHPSPRRSKTKESEPGLGTTLWSSCASALNSAYNAFWGTGEEETNEKRERHRERGSNKKSRDDSRHASCRGIDRKSRGDSRHASYRGKSHDSQDKSRRSHVKPHRSNTETRRSNTESRRENVKPRRSRDKSLAHHHSTAHRSGSKADSRSHKRKRPIERRNNSWSSDSQQWDSVKSSRTKNSVQSKRNSTRTRSQTKAFESKRNTNDTRPTQSPEKSEPSEKGDWNSVNDELKKLQLVNGEIKKSQPVNCEIEKSQPANDSPALQSVSEDSAQILSARNSGSVRISSVQNSSSVSVSPTRVTSVRGRSRGSTSPSGSSSIKFTRKPRKHSPRTRESRKFPSQSFSRSRSRTRTRSRSRTRSHPSRTHSRPSHSRSHSHSHSPYSSSDSTSKWSNRGRSHSPCSSSDSGEVDMVVQTNNPIKGARLMTKEQMVKSLVLDGGSISEKKRLKRSRNYHRDRSPSIDPEAPNKNAKVPDEWKNRIERAKKSRRKHARACKKAREKGSGSTESVPSSSSEFDGLWDNGEIKVLRKHSERVDKYYNKRDKQGKRLFKRAHSSSDNSFTRTHSSYDTGDDTGEYTNNKDSWAGLWQDLKDQGHRRYAKLMENVEKGFYHMAFNNDFTFDFNILGMFLNIEFKDMTGAIYSSAVSKLQSVLGELRGDAFGVIRLAAVECQDPALSLAQYMKCIYRYKAKPVVKLPPNTAMTSGEAVKASITVPNYQAIPQLIDQGVFRDGLCVAVRPSMVTVGLSVPGKKDVPFYMDLQIQISDLPMPSTPFSDPCHHSIQCTPKPSTDLFNGLTRQRLAQRGGSHENLTERYWSSKSLHSSQNLIISFRFRFTHLGKFASARRYGPEKPGWAIILRRDRPPRFSKPTDYGYVGLDQSVGIVCDPIQNILAIYKNGESHPFMSQNAAAFPPDMMGGWNLAQIQYRPDEKILITTMTSEAAPNAKYVAKFPVDVRQILGNTSKMLIGYSTATAQYAVPAIEDLSFLSPLPNLPQTRIFFTGLYSTQPHQRGSFLLQLHDSCGKVLPLSPVGLVIRLHRVRSVAPTTSQSSDSLVAHPDDQPLQCKVIPRPEQSLYEVVYRPTLPGRYRIYAALGKNPKEVRGNDHFSRKWYKVKSYHVYVRGLW